MYICRSQVKATYPLDDTVRFMLTTGSICNPLWGGPVYLLVTLCPGVFMNSSIAMTISHLHCHL